MCEISIQLNWTDKSLVKGGKTITKLKLRKKSSIIHQFRHIDFLEIYF